jgi:DNA-binding CsgD family transcriptional regulator/tetratricopeptide (TPR) repeat protein
VGAELDRDREAFEHRAWAEAFAGLRAADARVPLEPDDLERLATAAALTGHEEVSADAWGRAFHELVRRGDRSRAARCGFWLAMGLLNRGEAARGEGWLARARRQLEEETAECAALGYLALPAAISQVYGGETAAAFVAAQAAAGVGERCGDPDLVAFARLVQGRALMRMGRVAEGMSLLDEVMVSVLGDEVSPLLAGDVYCSVIEGCNEVFDLRRAHEWTVALTRWCDAQPDLVPYRGHCQVHRAEIMLRHGAWPNANDVAADAYDRLTRPPPEPAAGNAAYLLADLCRLRGEYAEAEESYREASRWGRDPQPGLALLRLAQGRTQPAEAAIRRALAETTDPAARPMLLAAGAEILLATGDVRVARDAVDELTAMAAGTDAPFLDAMAAHWNGAVRGAEGDQPAAHDALRRAWTLWQRVEAPYEAARVRVLLGHACRASGDEESALMEFEAAGEVFARLGAAPEAAQVAALTRRPRSAPFGLTGREVDVLRRVSTGGSNREIAVDLSLSEATVARHVSNILTKLDVRSRSAATAFAHRHGLV